MTLRPEELIKRRALERFDAVGIAAVDPLEAREHYQAWIESGRHGAMAYLATDRHRQRRAEPELVLPGLASVICVALCHPPDVEPGRDARLGRIARYASGEDYHLVMRDHLRAMEAVIRDALPGATVLGYSDTGAILERGWAERAGIGWVGKHTGVLSPRLGSWLLLAELLVDRPLEPDLPFARDHCGTCRRCIDACPTGAIVAERQLDARLCISYLTIELRGPIPVELRGLVGDWIFGCDVCQEVCPWNRFAPPAREARLHARSLEGWTLERFLELDAAAFDALFAGSPIRRARRAGFLRNVCVALGNRGASESAGALIGTLAEDPEWLVRSHAAWALGEIGARNGAQPRETIEPALRRAAQADSASEVRDEAAAALARLATRA